VSQPARTRVFVATADLAPGGLVAVEADGRRLLVCATHEGVFALENRCPHAAVPLDRGRLAGFELECPLHGGRLDVRDGSPRGHPIRRAATTFPVATVDGGIEIEID
jgi:nitrite reductase/ring-hydroxylating ferredoxin subunit